MFTFLPGNTFLNELTINCWIVNTACVPRTTTTENRADCSGPNSQILRQILKIGILNRWCITRRQVLPPEPFCKNKLGQALIRGYRFKRVRWFFAFENSVKNRPLRYLPWLRFSIDPEFRADWTHRLRALDRCVYCVLLPDIISRTLFERDGRLV